MNVHYTFSRVKKWGILLSPLLLFLLAMHWGLPVLRRNYQEAQLGLSASKNNDLVIFSKDSVNDDQIRTEFRQFRNAFQKVFAPFLDLKDLSRIRVYLFTNQEAFESFFETKFQEDLPNNAGFYDPTDRIISTFETEDDANYLRAIQHEAVHLFLEAGTERPDVLWNPWFNEGIASLFEKLEVSGKEVKISGISKEAFLYLQDANLLPLEQLLSSSGGHFRSRKNLIYYYQSEALIFYLLANYPDRFWSYFQYEQQEGRARKHRFEEIFGKPIADIETEFLSWLDSSKPFKEEIHFHLDSN